MKQKTNKATFRGVIMKSKFQIATELFGLRTAFVAGLTLFALLAAGISYWIAENQYLPALWETRPLHLFVPIVLCIVGIYFLLRKFDFSYRKPLLIIAVLIGAIILGIFLSRLSILDEPLQQTVYWGKTRSGKTYLIGTIRSYERGGVTVQMEDRTIVIVSFDAATHFPFGRPEVGTIVRVMGEKTGPVFRAYGIRPMNKMQKGCEQYGTCLQRKMK